MDFGPRKGTDILKPPAMILEQPLSPGALTINRNGREWGTLDQDVRLALAAYNAGISRVRRCRGIPPYPSTRRYLRKVLANYQEYRGEDGAG